jgi:hypothetical protein
LVDPVGDDLGRLVLSFFLVEGGSLGSGGLGGDSLLALADIITIINSILIFLLNFA